MDEKLVNIKFYFYFIKLEQEQNIIQQKWSFY